MMFSPRTISTAAGALALLVQAACGGAVIMDGGEGGAGGAGSTSGPDATSTSVGPWTTTSTGPAPTTSAGPAPTTSAGPAPTTSGGATPGASAIVFGDSTVTFHISSLALSCSDPDASPTDSRCSDRWDLELRMPESMFVVGEVDTASGDLSVYGTSFRADCSTAGATSGGGGDMGFGRLTITAIDATSVTFELSDVGPLFVDKDPNGRYVAARCAE
ncbi:hypothetical protein [Sorangium sp. So ce233]|uniref:hypothetical protein n=1 Tax=Sorangium sp. So ce233 TaxID=3133290 RepID=UPI003F5F01AB